MELATRILHLLGREGPRTPKPHRFIRYIYNRVLLEAPAVRAGEWRGGRRMGGGGRGGGGEGGREGGRGGGRGGREGGRGGKRETEGGRGEDGGDRGGGRGGGGMEETEDEGNRGREGGGWGRRGEMEGGREGERIFSPVLPIFPAAITSLAKFGASCDNLLDSILVLLDRSVFKQPHYLDPLNIVTLVGPPGV